MADVKDQEKFAKGQIAKARELGLDTDLFTGTFLGRGAKQAQRESDRLLDSLYEQADVSGMDLLTTGIMSGIEGKAMGDLVGNITSAFQPKVTPVDATSAVELNLKKQNIFPEGFASDFSLPTSGAEGFQSNFGKQITGMSPTNMLNNIFANF